MFLGANLLLGCAPAKHEPPGPTTGIEDVYVYRTDASGDPVLVTRFSGRDMNWEYRDAKLVVMRDVDAVFCSGPVVATLPPDYFCSATPLDGKRP